MTGDIANTDSKTTGMNWDSVDQPGYMVTEGDGAREDRAGTVSLRVTNIQMEEHGADGMTQLRPQNKGRRQSSRDRPH